MKKHLRWKKREKTRGLAAMYDGPSGSILHDGKLRYATVSYLKGRGWYWVAGWESKVPYKNTCDSPLSSEAEAKVAAKAYVALNS